MRNWPKVEGFKSAALAFKWHEVDYLNTFKFFVDLFNIKLVQMQIIREGFFAMFDSKLSPYL